MRRLGLLALASSGLALACGAILDLPDPNVDPNFGLKDGSSSGMDGPGMDGSSADGTYPDGAMPDGGGTDSPIPTCGGKNCFGGACVADVCQPFAIATASDPNLIDTDDASVYFVSGSDTIYRLDPADGGLTPLVTGESGINGLQVVPGAVYWSSDPGKSSTVTSCSTPSCGTRVDYMKTAGVTGLAVGPSYVYAAAPVTGIWECMLGSSCISTPKKLLATTPQVIRADSTKLYWASAAQNGIYQCPSSTCMGGGSPLSSGINELALDPNDIYFAYNGDSLSWQSKSSGMVKPVAAAQKNPIVIRTDNTYVYWLNHGSPAVFSDGSIERCKLETDCMASPETLVNPLKDAVGLAVTGDSIYFTSQVTGTVYRLAK